MAFESDISRNELANCEWKFASSNCYEKTLVFKYHGQIRDKECYLYVDFNSNESNKYDVTQHLNEVFPSFDIYDFTTKYFANEKLDYDIYNIDEKRTAFTIDYDLDAHKLVIDWSKVIEEVTNTSWDYVSDNLDKFSYVLKYKGMFQSKMYNMKLVFCITGNGRELLSEKYPAFDVNKYLKYCFGADKENSVTMIEFNIEKASIKIYLYSI